MAEASSAALESASTVTTELSLCRGLDAPGVGPLMCSAWGRRVLVVLCPPGLCLSWREAGSWAVSLAPCAPGPALLELRSWPRSSLSAEPPELLSSCSHGLVAPPVWSLCQSRL